MTSGKDTRLERLGSVPLFSSCTAEQLALIEQAAREVEFAAGDVICRHGDPGTDFFLVLEGEASIKRYGKRVASLKPGGAFGELALLTGLRRNATVVAVRGSTLLALAEQDFAVLLDRVPGLAHKLLSELARRLADADEKAATR
jgi:CRP-like cAMP-binding protein